MVGLFGLAVCRRRAKRVQGSLLFFVLYLCFGLVFIHNTHYRNCFIATKHTKQFNLKCGYGCLLKTNVIIIIIGLFRVGI